MYLSFGKNDSNEIKSNMAYIYQLWQILHVLERMLSRETTPSHRIKSYVTSFFLCPAFEMKDWWLDDEAGYPEGGFPFSIITVCVSFFFLLWREILDRCVLTAHSQSDCHLPYCPGNTFFRLIFRPVVSTSPTFASNPVFLTFVFVPKITLCDGLL